MPEEMTELAIKHTGELVDVEALGSYAKAQWDLGDQAADEAGEPYWFRGAEALEKAKPSVLARGEETFGEYQERVTGRSEARCREHRLAYRNRAQLVEDATKTRNGARARAPQIPHTIAGLTGKSTAGQ